MKSETVNLLKVNYLCSLSEPQLKELVYYPDEKIAMVKH